MFIPVLCYPVPICIHVLSSGVHLAAGPAGVGGHPTEPWPPEHSCTSPDSAPRATEPAP